MSFSGLRAALVTVMTMSVACVATSSTGRRSDVAALPPDRPLAFRDAKDQLLLLNQPGKLYLLDFVAVGCKPCAQELPDLARLEQEFGSSGRFQLVTVVYAWQGRPESRQSLTRVNDSHAF
jgi:thiol-disulfide isomerase/thioredoxin